MTHIRPSVIDREYITRFFRDRNIDDYAFISASSLHAPKGRRPCDLLPSARTHSPIQLTPRLKNYL